MTEIKEKRKSAEVRGELAKVAQLLDPHLSESAELKKGGGTKRWPALKAYAFIFGGSLLIWALAIALIHYLL
jgi:hypothetical protein